ncbi:MAG: cysteine desulfurase NifS [Chitinivibrionia bacterium]|nr:cysteine desulfurase NifS [Chitinivibrionia bacterium]
MNIVYLDNNATTRIAPEVFEEMKPFLTANYGNPSSMYKFGAVAGAAVKEARGRICSLINCKESELVFTSCGTESDNYAIRGVLDAYPDKKHIITTRVEHPAVLNTVTRMGKRGYKVTLLGVDREGRLNPDELRDALTDDTALVSIMYANNETGVIFPIEKAGEMVKARGIPFHVDAVQAIGKLPIDMEKLPVDLMSFSGHKLHAPKGIGALYIRRGTRIQPFMLGGHQERNRRGGTENVPYIAGLGKACDLARETIAHEQQTVRRLRDKLESGILSTIPGSIRNGHKDDRLPNTSNISFEYIEGEAILLLMDELGICASSGSACTSGALEPSHVLRAMGVPFTLSHGSVRFSLSRYTTEEEIDFVLKELPPIIQRLRNISPYWQESMAGVKKTG